MNTKPQTTKQRARDERNLQLLIDHVRQYPSKSFEESEISNAIQEATSEKVPKAQVRRLLNNHPCIDQDLLNYGKPNGKVRWKC